MRWICVSPAGRDCSRIGGGRLGWVGLDGWLAASFSQLCTNKLARRNLLHQRCQMPLQRPHLLYKLIEGVRFQSILLWYNHFSCPLAPLSSPQFCFWLLDFLTFFPCFPCYFLQALPARVLHRGAALRLQHAGEAGATRPGTQCRLVESR